MLAAVIIQSTLGRGLPTDLIVQCIYFHTKKYYHTLEGDCPYRILCSVLLGTADNVIWPDLSFQVDTHWQEVKGIKSYLQCMEGAEIWQKQLSTSWMDYPPKSSKPVISQHSVGCSVSVCMFVWLCACMFRCVCVYLFMCACVYVCVRWLMHLKIWQKQLRPSCQYNPHEASKFVISQLLVVPTTG
jgi:hypothetical protein